MSSKCLGRKENVTSERVNVEQCQGAETGHRDDTGGHLGRRTELQETGMDHPGTKENGPSHVPVSEDRLRERQEASEELAGPGTVEGQSGLRGQEGPRRNRPGWRPDTGGREKHRRPWAPAADADSSVLHKVVKGRGQRVQAGAMAILVRNRWAAAAGAFLIFMYSVALFAGFFAPYGINQTHYRAPADFAYHPPMIPRIRDETGRFHWPPFVYGTKRVPGEGVAYKEDQRARHPLRLFARGEQYNVAFGLIKWDRHLFGVQEPGRFFLLGTDQFGRDLLSRIIYGSRISLSIGLLGIAITFTLGLAIGAASGFFGGLVDSLLMRTSEVVMSLPGLYLVVALAGVLPAGLRSDVRYLLIVAILSLVGWAGLSRVIRGMVLSIRENDYVLAAKAIGAKNGRILLRHVIPNTMSYVIVAATLSVPYYILGEVSLSYLGVGIKEPHASWGLMLSDAQSVTALREFTWLLLPGAFVFLVVISFNILGDGLRDSFDPKASHTRAF